MDAFLKLGKRLTVLLFAATLFIVFGRAIRETVTVIKAYAAAEREYAGLQELARTKQKDGNMEGIDFDSLRAVNPNIIGWIAIPGTGIDYPIVQGTDNTVYLRRTAEGQENDSGAIFLDFRNADDFSDSNSIVYGHRMNNGSMFAALSSYKDQDFCKTHRTVRLYLPDGMYVYEVFAAYVTTAAGAAYVVELPDEEALRGYIDAALAQSVFSADTEVTTENQILTLSTCDYTFENARMVVHAVRVS